MVRPLAFALALLSATVAVASAETPEQRQACTDDAFQFCSHAIPDRNRVFSCLVEKRAQISRLCVAGLAPYLPPEPAAAKKAAKSAKPAAKPAAKTAAQQPNGKPLSLSPTGR